MTGYPPNYFYIDDKQRDQVLKRIDQACDNPRLETVTIPHWIVREGPGRFNSALKRHRITPAILSEQIGNTPHWWARHYKKGTWSRDPDILESVAVFIAKFETVARSMGLWGWKWGGE